MTPNRPTRLGCIALLGAALGIGGCANSRAGVQRDADRATERHVRNTVGPFDVAERWAARLTDHQSHRANVPANVRAIIARWNSAHVERVWASGSGYRAVIVQKSTAKETPAVLLRIGSDGAGKWTITGLQPTTSTQLWSRL